ncbi:MAG: DNA/RNA non-specific endonuclease [Acinetobacter sp.]|nr:DNA/RNA non-specific endonuclease [Acinetobacter sp.]
MAEAEEEAKEQREQQARQKPSPPPLQQKIIPSGSKGKWAKPLNQKLEPNTCYQVDGDKVYETDHLGRVVKVEAMLSPSVKDRNTYQQRKAGKSGNPGDEGGHLIASIFNGPGEQINLLPMDGNLNKGEWKKMENKWAEALNAGSTVQVKIEPIYHGNNTRPDKFKVVYSMDHGKPIEKIFKNAPGGK